MYTCGHLVAVQTSMLLLKQYTYKLYISIYTQSYTYKSQQGPKFYRFYSVSLSTKLYTYVKILVLVYM